MTIEDSEKMRLWHISGLCGGVFQEATYLMEHNHQHSTMAHSYVLPHIDPLGMVVDLVHYIHLHPIQMHLRCQILTIFEFHLKHCEN